MAHSINSLPRTPFTAKEARARGISRWLLRSALADGRLTRVFRGVYVPEGLELTPQVRAQCLALVVGPGAVVRDRTAAWLWGVDVFEFAELDGVPDIEISALRGGNAAERNGVAGGTRDLRPDDWVELCGVRVTTPLRTAMDLGCILGRRSALAAMDALARIGGFTVVDLERALPRYRRRRGVIQLRQLVPLVDGRAESMSESWTRLEIIDHGLPAPVPNFWVIHEGVKLFRLDLAYPRAKICVEYDGEEFHSSPEQRAYDEQRRTWLRQHGWFVIVLTKVSFTDAAIQEWIRLLREELRVRTRRPAPAYRGARFRG